MVHEVGGREREQMRGATVVVAAGHGCLRPGMSKLAETVDRREGTSMVGRVLQTACLVGDPIVLVLNERFADQVMAAVERDCPDLVGGEMRMLLHVCYQHERRGAADAVHRAVTKVISKLGIRAFLVMYGDMPLWRPATMRRLWALHQAARATLSMVSVEIGEDASRHTLERYGRVLKDAQGRIVNVVEPGETKDVDVLRTTTVNPSLYVFETDWFIQSFGSIPPHPRPDGYGDEFHLPPLARIAAEQGTPVAELQLEDPEEALGVNTSAEIEEIREIVARRHLVSNQRVCATG